MAELSLEAGSSVESCAHRFSFSNCCETLNAEFPGTFSLFGNVNFKEIFLRRLPLELRCSVGWQRLLHLHFHRF